MTEGLVSRKEALARGLRRYFTGKPCKHGHVAERRVSNRECSLCARHYARCHLDVLAANMCSYRQRVYLDPARRLKRNEDKRNYEQRKSTDNKYMEKKRLYHREYCRSYYKNHPERATAALQYQAECRAAALVAQEIGINVSERGAMRRVLRALIMEGIA